MSRYSEPFLTVSELISELQKFPPNEKVVVYLAAYRPNDKVVTGVKEIRGASVVLIESKVLDIEGR